MVDRLAITDLGYANSTCHCELKTWNYCSHTLPSTTWILHVTEYVTSWGKHIIWINPCYMMIHYMSENSKVWYERKCMYEVLPNQHQRFALTSRETGMPLLLGRWNRKLVGNGALSAWSHTQCSTEWRICDIDVCLKFIRLVNIQIRWKLFLLCKQILVEN